MNFRPVFPLLLVAAVFAAGPTPASAQCFDEYEPNDAFGDAIGLIFDWPAESIVCDSADVDYFTITLAVGQQISARIENNPHLATVELFTPGQAPIGQADSPAGFGEVVHTATVAGDHYIRISGTSGGSQNPYQVTVLDLGGGPTPTPAPTPTPTPRFPGCPDGFEPNDVLGGPSFDASSGPLVSYICAATDVDYFRIGGVSQNQTIQVDLQSLPKNYDLMLYRPDLTLAASSSEAGQADEQIVANANVAGTWFIGVVGNGQFDASNPYTVQAQLFNCSIDGRERNESAPDATSLGHPTSTHTEPNLTVCPPQDEDWFSLDVVAGERIIADVTHVPAQGPVRMCLVDPNGSTDWRCTNGILNTERIDYIVPSGGKWYLRGEAVSQGTTNPAYSIATIVHPPPPTPTPCPADANEAGGGNDDPGSSTRTGVCTSGTCQTRYTATGLSICPGDEDWFDLNADDGDLVEVRLDFVHLNGDIDVTLYTFDGTLNPIASATSTHDDEYLFSNITVNNTSLFVQVFAKSPAGSNANYDIEIQRLPRPTPSPTPVPTPSPTPSPTPTAVVCAPGDILVDLSLQEIEVTQSIQNLTHDMPLIGRKTTHARIYVQGDRDIFLPRPVTAYLRGEKFDGTPLIPATVKCYGYLQNVRRRGTSMAVERARSPRLGLSCRLPIAWRARTHAPNLITAHVDPPTGVCDQNGANDEDSIYTDFEPPAPLFVQAAQVRPSGCNSASCGPDWWSYRYIHRLAERMWPTNRIKLIPAGGIFIPWTTNDDTATDAQVKFYQVRDQAKKAGGWKLAGQTDANTVVAGMVTPWTGLGQRGNSSGKGFWVSADRPDTFAHELGHSAGELRHVQGCMSGAGNGTVKKIEKYPYDTKKLSNLHPRSYWGLDTEGSYPFPKSIHPDRHADMLTYCLPDRWASDFTYRGFANEQTGNDVVFPPRPSPIPVPARAIAAGPVVRLMGTIDVETDEVVLLPLFFADESAGPIEDGSLEVEYRAELLDAAGDPLAGESFHLEPFQDSPSTRASFTVELLAPSPPAGVAIYRDDVELFRRTASANPPTLAIDPVVGIVPDLLPLSWTAADPDGDPVSTEIEVSGDGGDTWTPLASQLEVSATDVDTRFWGGTATGMIRVTATDGFHRISQTTGPFSVPFKAPVLDVVAPEDGVEVRVGEPVHLRAHAYDPEEAFLDGDALAWRSDVDGPLGTGEELLVDDLTPGWHEITVEATDGDGSLTAHSIFLCASDLACDSAPSECPTAGFAPDGDGDGVCDRIDVCPDHPDPGQGDGDDDGAGDACDPCTGGATHASAKLRLVGVANPEGADRLRYNATLELPGAEELSVAATGLHLAVTDALGVSVVDLLLPPGDREGPEGGWFSSGDGTRQRFVTGPDADGPQVRATVRSYRHRPGILKVTIHVRRAAFPTAGLELPLRANVSFTPGVGATGECADAAFGEELDGCRESRDGRRVTCG